LKGVTSFLLGGKENNGEKKPTNAQKRTQWKGRSLGKARASRRTISGRPKGRGILLPKGGTEKSKLEKIKVLYFTKLGTKKGLKGKVLRRPLTRRDKKPG